MEHQNEREFAMPLVMRCGSWLEEEEISYAVVDLDQQVIEAANERQAFVLNAVKSMNHIASITFLDSSPQFYDYACEELEGLTDDGHFQDHGWAILSQPIRLPGANHYPVKFCFAEHSPNGFNWLADPEGTPCEVWTVTLQVSELLLQTRKAAPRACA